MRKIVFSTECGGDISGKSEGEIDSPGFGVENYPKDITCTWKITVEEGKLIKIFSTYVNTESDADIIYFYDTTTGKLLDRLVPPEDPLQFYSYFYR